MLHLAKQLYGASVEAADGRLGKLCDFLFHDQDYTIRSLVIDGGTWLNRRRITLPPDLIAHRDWADHRLFVSGMSRHQVLTCQHVETHVAVGGGPQHADAMVVDWSIYWTDVLQHPWQVSEDPHLHNTQVLTGYHLQALDGPIGHIADFLVDDEAWTIRFLAIDTRNWWPGKHVLIPPTRVQTVHWTDHVVDVQLQRETIEQCPQYDPQALAAGAEISTWQHMT